MKILRDISEFVLPGEAAVLKAPNGKKSNLSEKLYKLVRTTEFKSWFGDWEKNPENASKIVDGNGEPMVVYHGTPSYGFKEFMNDYKLPRATVNETNNLGSWFTNDRHSAESFMFKSDKAGIYEVFLNIRNPKVFKPAIFNKFEIDALLDTIHAMEADKYRLGQNTNSMSAEDREKYDDMADEISELYDRMRLLRRCDSFEQFMNYRDKYAEYDEHQDKKPGNWLDRYINMNKDEANKRLVKEFKDEQYDGIAIIDTHYDAPRKNSKVSQFCVFDPTSIKSVDNNGRFDNGTKNIYESNIYVKGLDSFDI